MMTYRAAVLGLLALPHGSDSFTPSILHHPSSNTQPSHLLMAKSKSLNKQADLRRKMERVKQQKEEEIVQSGMIIELTAQEIKERNDRLRFEELLKKEAGNVLNDYGSDSYLSKQQEEEEITAARKGVDRIFEGDPAPTECFEDLVSVQTGTAIGVPGKKQLVPWLSDKGNPSDYLIIVSDPRPQSSELQETIKQFQSDLPEDLKKRLIVINADTPSENKRWLKKTSLDVRVYSDEKLSWMRAYTALGDKRWSMTMFIIANEQVQKLAREMDQYGASKAIRNAVKTLGNR
ncbi:hypothetical protein FisN_18Lh062 [Fistulifera solaris]|uniref:Uncharacterized protein n=1 Tax=Fistulifera solaris TaxID=1519565 RepID=A0A1Z5KDW7_FISSO|nr:hypothetical protein FisN_18Lh062 [Fistulifera solaris]|eukprot:GAX24510.1 hypothetical protein FisN_18Lh062 [Fistulifera solaris]